MSEPAPSAPRTAAALAARHRDTQAALGRIHEAITRLRREKTPVSVAPANLPPRASFPSRKPTIGGANTAVRPGAIISCSAAVVLMATHREESGLAFPSIKPGISLN